MFRRLAAHLLRTSQTAPLKQIEEMLTDSLEYEDFPGYSPEFDKLLTERFAALSERGKARVFSYLEKGPDLTGFKKRKESEGKPASEEEVAEIADFWRLKWLHRIHANLPSEWRDKYSTLLTRFGPASADETGPRFGSWVGPKSPKSSEELQEMSGDELIEYLRTWQSSGSWNAPSPEGLGRALSAMLAAEPQKLANNATLLRGLDPTYIRFAIEGFTTALKNRQSFDWAQVIELCEWVLAQGNETKESKGAPEQSDPDWNWTRQSITRFLAEALNAQGQSALPLSERKRVWALLELLAEDAVPDESSYGKGVFFGSTSLNFTRGVALEGMLQYARWLHGQAGEPPTNEHTLDSMPELRRALEKHLASDKSVVAREVFGRNFPTLFWLDRKWATNAAALIFGEEDRALGEVAWANYLLFCPPYDQLLPILVDYYRKAIDQIGTSFRKDVDEIDRHLAQHLMLFYWRGHIDIDSEDGLITRFFSRGPAGMRSHAIEFIGRNLHGAAAVEPEIRERLKRLWEWRLAELSQRRCDGEAIPFGIWFASGQFDLDWSFDNLLAVLRLCHKAELDFWVVERLAQVVQQRPTASVQALGMMIEADQEGWAMHGWSDHPRTVLETALKSTDQRAQEDARRVIHLLGSRGWYGYRDLLHVRGSGT